MATRQVIFCDLCEKEIDRKSGWYIIKGPKGLIYDIHPNCMVDWIATEFPLLLPQPPE